MSESVRDGGITEVQKDKDKTIYFLMKDLNISPTELGFKIPLDIDIVNRLQQTHIWFKTKEKEKIDKITEENKQKNKPKKKNELTFKNAEKLFGDNP